MSASVISSRSVICSIVTPRTMAYRARPPAVTLAMASWPQVRHQAGGSRAAHAPGRRDDHREVVRGHVRCGIVVVDEHALRGARAARGPGPLQAHAEGLARREPVAAREPP